MIPGPVTSVHFIGRNDPMLPRNSSESAGSFCSDIADDRLLRERIGINLMNLRYKLGLKQGKASELMGLSRTQWRKYESGVETLRTDTAMSWCLLTGVSFYRLFCGTSLETNLPHIKFLPLLDECSPLLDPVAEAAGRCQASGLNMRPLPDDPVKVNQMRDELRHEGAGVLGAGLRAVRQQGGFTQEHFADELRVSLSAYQNYEKHLKPSRFSLIFAGRVLHLTGLPPCELFRSSRFHDIYQAREKQFFECARRLGTIRR